MNDSIIGTSSRVNKGGTRTRPKSRVNNGSNYSRSMGDETKAPRADMLSGRPTKLSSGTINRSWTPIGDGAVTTIVDLLDDSVAAVVGSIDGSTNRREFQKMAQKMTSSVPIPPKSREGVFDYEGNEEYKARLEAVLLPLMEQISQLDGQILQEQRQLDTDTAYLSKMVADFKGSEEFNPNSFRAANNLVDKINSISTDIADDSEAVGYAAQPSYDSKVSSDENLNSALSKIADYVDRLKQNSKGVPTLLGKIDNLLDLLGPPNLMEEEEEEEEGQEEQGQGVGIEEKEAEMSQDEADE